MRYALVNLDHNLEGEEAIVQYFAHRPTAEEVHKACQGFDPPTVSVEERPDGLFVLDLGDDGTIEAKLEEIEP